ncbi:MAG: TonB-dependent receptor [Calditrichaeota bacterium]|nr:MAG: TonB-dependent receptor [Calditrichota bacterium]MBL1205074.1 TonB-dependent receptor [Calditrichota bacterium]NOG44904.1 TonB-dependent receptor [Calditrichota bacterium]
MYQSNTTKKFLAILFAITLLFTTNSVFGQGVTTAAMNGVIVDVDGEPLPGANVEVLHDESGTKYGAATRVNGRFDVPNIRVGGPYTIIVSYIGFQSQKLENVYIGLGQNQRFEFILKETSLSTEAIVVEAGVDDIINPNRTGASTNIGQQQIEELPTISRSAQDIYRLTPQASGNSFGGRNNYYNNFSLDGSIFNNSFGLDVPTPGGQTNAQPVSLDAIEQIQVSIAPFDVRQGGFTGAGINSVTRSGTNRFSGSFYNFMRNENFIGDDVSGTVVENPNLTYRQTGFRLGGPIIKNELFFFINAEQERREEPATTIISNTGSNSGANVSRVAQSDLNEVISILDNQYGYKTGAYQGYDHQTENDKFLMKINWNVNTDHQASFRYNHLTSWRDVLPHPAISAGGRGPDLNSVPFENTSYMINNNINSYVAELNSSFGSFSNHLRLGYTSFRDFRDSKSAAFPSVDINKDGLNYISFGLERFSTNNLLDQDVFQFTDDITTYLDEHIITAGISYESFQFNNSFNLFFYPGHTFSSMDEFRAATNPLDPSYIDFNAEVARSDSNAFKLDEVDLAQLSFYVQDEWQATDDLILTGGLRVDMPIYFTEPANNAEILAETFNDENGNDVKFDVSKLPDTSPLWSPRLGFNWDVNSDRTFQLRGGTGVFTGRLRFVWISNQISNAAIAPFYTFQINSTVDDFKWPQTWRTNLAIDKELPFGIIGTLEGIFSKDINAVVHRNYNMAPPTGKAVGADNREIFASTDSTAENKLNGFFTGGPLGVSFLDAGAIILDNTDEGYQYSITGQLQKKFGMDLTTSIAYTFSEAKDITSSPGEIAADAFQLNQIVGNPNKPELAFSDFGLRHRFVGTASYKKQWNDFLGTSVSLFFEAAQGDRFSYVYAGDMNLDGIPQNNDLMYVPQNSSEINLVPVDASDTRTEAEIWSQLNNYIKQDDYLSERRGKYAERNGALGEWFSEIDIRLLQDFNFDMGQDKHTFQLSLDILNLGNLINPDWGVRRFPINKAPLTFVGYNSDGEPEFSFPLKDGKPLSETFTDNTSLISRWRIQVGVRYLFN